MSSSVARTVVVKAPLYGLKPVYVDLSPEHEALMKRHGLDRLKASAHLIAVKHLKNMNGLKT